MDWIKLHVDGILEGSLSTTSNTTQIIWVKLLAMVGRTRNRDGYLRYKEGLPYPKEMIAITCNVTLNELEEALSEFTLDIRDGQPRVIYADDGSLYLTNWKNYQANQVNHKDTKQPLTDNQEKAITRKLTNKHPESARDALSYGFNDTIIDKSGEILRENGEIKEV